MSKQDSCSEHNSHLRAGQFYGHSVNKQRVAGLILSELVHADGKLLPRHSHEMGFFSLLLEGAYREFFRTRTIHYRPMTIVWHPPDLTHLDEIGCEGGKFFTVEVQPDWLDRLREFAAVPDILFDVHGGDLVWLALRMYREHKEARGCSPLVLEGLLLEMLALATRVRLPNEKTPPAWLARVIDRLHAEFQHTLLTSDLASDAGVHPVHLAAVFRQFHHQTIGEYQQRLRVQFASQLLGDFDLPLVEVAQFAGFSDQSHLTRLFKRFSGMTPGAFRALLTAGEHVPQAAALLRNSTLPIRH
ncbi:MAG TPA: AraC family transcriptional regulator [Blastocatellia bacterium]|jgi:AraC family transcriptional regulator